MFWAELLVVLIMLIIGARYDGIFLGMSGGFAIAILVFGFGLAPGNPAIDVIMIIMTVVVIAATAGYRFRQDRHHAYRQVRFQSQLPNPRLDNVYRERGGRHGFGQCDSLSNRKIFGRH